MIKKSAFLLGITAILQVAFLLSCSDDDDCGPFPNRFKTNGIGLNNKKLENPDADPIDYIFNSVPSAQALKDDQYFIEIAAIIQTYTVMNQQGFSFITKAYACSPLLPQSDETVLALSVKANADISSQYPAGSDLSQLFDIVVVDYHSRKTRERTSLSNFLASGPNAKDMFYLVLNSPIENPGSYKFEVSYSLTLGGEEKAFTKETAEVLLEPSL